MRSATSCSCCDSSSSSRACSAARRSSYSSLVAALMRRMWSSFFCIFTWGPEENWFLLRGRIGGGRTTSPTVSKTALTPKSDSLIG